MQPSQSVLILGARGRFGQAAARAFAQAGWRVHAQLRPGAAGHAPAGPAIPGVQWLHAAPEDTAALAAAAKSAQVVVNALSPIYTHKAWRTQVPRLTQAAIDISRELGALLMLPASVYNFGESMPARLLEDTAQAAQTFKGRTRIASEQQVLEATKDGGMKAVVIRGGDFFGSGTGSWFDLSMAKDLRAGKFTYAGPLNLAHAWAYLPDMAKSFVSVAQHRSKLPSFETLHFAGYNATGQDWADVLADVAREQGWLPASGQLKVERLSWPLMRLVGLFVPTVAALCEVRYLWTTPHQFVDRRMAQLTGEVHRTPFREAVRTALDELGYLKPLTQRIDQSALAAN